ncbi:MAG: hypothetical protein C4543_10930 [Ignavibacteriales bacterium]|jgi:hypothetical protein|nr:hypothetical protein [Melioribacteraceae bacterium]RJP56724.1 MAG: hypothetical protein C4543_10930 [Ignavibacteriales bacterium]
MNSVIDILNKIDELINNCLQFLITLDPDNFDTNYNGAFSALKQARLLRETIDLESLDAESEKILKKIDINTKLIKKEYDNVIRNYSTEIDNIRIEMRNISNKRKLASYSKGEL